MSEHDKPSQLVGHVMGGWVEHPVVWEAPQGLDPSSYDTHKGPGRRLAEGCTRGDTILAAFGLFSHFAFFAALGALPCVLWPSWSKVVLEVAAVASVVCLVVRFSQVGGTTTAESARAVRKAWRGTPKT